MDHRFYSPTRLAQGVKIPNVRLGRFVIAFSGQGFGIEQPEGKVFAQQRHDVGSDSASGAGDENSFAHEFPYCAVQPPSIKISVPVIKPASSEQRYNASFPTSSTCPQRPSGILERNSAFRP